MFKRFFATEMNDNAAIITTTAPINVGIIKYLSDPNVKNLFPITDYVTVTLDPNVVSAKASVCARREFTEDKFWLNGVEARIELQFCLNEVKYRAANQRSVSVEFLTRKVHVACENKFLPAFGTSSFSAGFISLMTALCKLYKIRPNSVRNQPMFPDLMNFNCGGFVQSRELYANTKNFKGKVIAEGKHWPELRVLVLVVLTPTKEPPNKGYKKIIRWSKYIAYRTKECVPTNVKRVIKTIKEKKFELFADVIMRDNNQFHAINVDTYPPRIHKNDVSNKIVEVVRVYNRLCGTIRVGYTFDTGPNAVLFFLEKDAQEVIGLVKHIFPSTNPNFMEGLPPPPDLDPGHFYGFSVEPVQPNKIHHIIYTKVGDATVQYDRNHILDENGEVISTPLPSPFPETDPILFQETASFPFQETLPFPFEETPPFPFHETDLFPFQGTASSLNYSDDANSRYGGSNLK